VRPLAAVGGPGAALGLRTTPDTVGRAVTELVASANGDAGPLLPARSPAMPWSAPIVRIPGRGVETGEVLPGRSVWEITATMETKANTVPAISTPEMPPANRYG